jgi:hypothetical protein
MEDSPVPVFTAGRLYPVLNFGADGYLVMDDMFEDHWIGMPDEYFINQYFDMVTGAEDSRRGSHLSIAE